MLDHPNLGEVLNDMNHKLTVPLLGTDLTKHHEYEQDPSESVDAPLTDQSCDAGCGDSIHGGYPPSSTTSLIQSPCRCCWYML